MDRKIRNQRAHHRGWTASGALTNADGIIWREQPGCRTPRSFESGVEVGDARRHFVAALGEFARNHLILPDHDRVLFNAPLRIFASHFLRARKRLGNSVLETGLHRLERVEHEFRLDLGNRPFQFGASLGNHSPTARGGCHEIHL
jgi:hypothetical protein